MVERYTPGTDATADAQPNDPSNSIQALNDHLAQAHKAYEDNDSKAVVEHCEAILKIDPENKECWILLAKFGGWDSKLFDFDTGTIIRSIKHALSLADEEERYPLASEIYTARKKQISERMEEAMMMPSYTSIKLMHQIMIDWKRLLTDIPYLTRDLLESEIVLCNNLCTRSKMGIMPADRVVYTAYATFNGKESYGEMFRKALENRLQAEEQRENQASKELQKEVEQRLAQYKEQVEKGRLTLKEEKALLEKEIDTLNKEITRIVNMSNKSSYEQQVDELEKQLGALKPYKIMRRKTIETQLAEVRDKLKQIDAQIESSTRALRTQAEMLQSRLNEIT